MFVCECGYTCLANSMVVQIGKTKVFLRAGQMAELDARRAEVLSNAAKTIQRRIRTHQARKQFIALRKTTIAVQSIWRGEPFDPNLKKYVHFVGIYFQYVY